MRSTLAAFVALLATAATTLAWPQLPIPSEPHVPDVTPNDPFHTFVNHCEFLGPLIPCKTDD